MKILNITLLFLTIFLSVASYAQEKNYVENQIIVKLKDKHNFSLESDKTTFGLSELDILNKENQLKTAKSIHQSKENRSFVLEFQNDKNISEIIKDYERSDLFEFVEHNYLVHATGYSTMTSEDSTNDTFYSRQWALKNDGSFSTNGAISVAGADINMEPAWEIEKGDASVIVAVIDTGINFVHPEFEDRIWENPNVEEDDGYELDLFGWNFVDNDNNVFDDEGHGTAVSGVIAAKPNNSLGFAGVDWHCKILTVKALDAEGTGNTAAIIEGIYYAVDHGANVINMSLGGGNYSLAFVDAIDYAMLNNVTLIAAMGNDNSSEVSYPAGYINVIAVGATNPNDRRSDAFNDNPNYGSNFGGHIDVVAPGGFIYILDYNNTNNYQKISSGTSLAAPYVSGLASLLIAQDATRTPEQIRDIVRSTADDQVGRLNEDTEGFDNYHGFGRINAYKALSQSTLSVTDNEMEKVLIYPNPATDYFSIQNDNLTKLDVFSITGKLLLSRKINSGNEINQNVSDWNSGVYILRLENEKGQFSVEKLIVK